MPEDAVPRRDGEPSVAGPAESHTPAQESSAAAEASTVDLASFAEATESAPALAGVGACTSTLGQSEADVTQVVTEQSFESPSIVPGLRHDEDGSGDAVGANGHSADDGVGVGVGSTSGVGVGVGVDGDSSEAQGSGRKLTRAFVIVSVLAALLVIGATIGGVALLVNRDKGTSATRGDCLAGDGIDPGNRKTRKVSLKTVTCSDASARYKVVGRVDDRAESAAQADSKLCDKFPGTEFIYWEGLEGEAGTVLCLATNSPASATTGASPAK